MINLLSSATKLVLLMMSLTVCISFLMGRIEPVLFLPIVTLVLGAYYGNKMPNDNAGSSVTTTVTPSTDPKVSTDIKTVDER